MLDSCAFGTSSRNDKIRQGFEWIVQPYAASVAVPRLWRLLDRGGLDVPVVIRRKPSPPHVESLPLNARSRSALRGCARLGRKQKAAEPLELLVSEFPASTSKFQSCTLHDNSQSQTPSKRLADGLDLLRISDRPLFNPLHKRSSYAPQVPTITQRVPRYRGLAVMHQTC